MRKLPRRFEREITIKSNYKVRREKNKNVIKEGFNTDLIFSCVLYLLGMDQVEFKNLFDFELTPVPTSLIKNTGEPLYTTSKATLKNKNQRGSALGKK